MPPDDGCAGGRIMLQCIVIGVITGSLGVAISVFLQREGEMVTRVYDRYWPLPWKPSAGVREFQFVSAASLTIFFTICVTLQTVLGICI
jgi:hypothetical protein